jgi:hypothetical protein
MLGVGRYGIKFAKYSARRLSILKPEEDYRWMEEIGVIQT